MDLLLKEKIKRRALEVLHVTQRLLLDDESCYEAGEAYRFAFLILRRPKKFLETFEAGELAIDAKAVAEVYWHYRNDISYEPGLIYEERLVIAEHNQAVESLRNRSRASQSQLSLVVS